MPSHHRRDFPAIIIRLATKAPSITPPLHLRRPLTSPSSSLGQKRMFCSSAATASAMTLSRLRRCLHRLSCPRRPFRPNSSTAHIVARKVQRDGHMTNRGADIVALEVFGSQSGVFEGCLSCIAPSSLRYYATTRNRRDHRDDGSDITMFRT